MGLDHRSQEQEGCRVSQGIRWQRCELPFIRSFHGLQKAGRYTMACRDGGRGGSKSIKAKSDRELAEKIDRNENKEVGHRGR